MKQKEKVWEVINGVIIDRVTEMIEDMSNRDFVENIMDRLQNEGELLLDGSLLGHPRLYNFDKCISNHSHFL